MVSQAAGVYEDFDTFESFATAVLSGDAGGFRLLMVTFFPLTFPHISLILSLKLLTCVFHVFSHFSHISLAFLSHFSHRATGRRWRDGEPDHYGQSRPAAEDRGHRAGTSRTVSGVASTAF